MSMNKFKKYVFEILDFTKLLPIIESLRLVNNLNLKYGYYGSVYQQKPIDKQGKPIPWFTYPAIEFLNSLNLSKAKVFEWGSGYSSLYWAKMCKNVISIENNKEWFVRISAKMKTEKLKNLKIILKNDSKSYIRSISQLPSSYKSFDIIDIDGLNRLECSKISLSRIKKNGIIILDNAELFPNIVTLMKSKGYTEIPMIGPGPINSYLWKTSLFLRSF
jgi:precorrin-6B methylase 2